MSFPLPGQRSSGQGVRRERVLEGTEDSPCDTARAAARGWAGRWGLPGSRHCWPGGWTGARHRPLTTGQARA